MASETVTKIPGLDDLLINAMTFTDYKRVGQAAENVAYPIDQGIGAIGDLMFCASQSECGLDPDTMGNIGCLLKHLAEMSVAMRLFRDNAAFMEAHPNAATSSPQEA